MTRTRSSALVLLATAAALAGCGGGSKSTTAAKQQAGATTAQATTTAPTTTTSAGPPGHSTSTQASPPPAMATTGNGGTEPARTDVELVGRGGKVTPATVNVAPFIAVKLTLRSSDGAAYHLAGRGLTLTASAAKRSAAGTLPGLRTGASYTLGGSSTVVITASGEPGP